MENDSIIVVFFDVGDTLGAPVLSPPPMHLERLDVYSWVPGVLEKLRATGRRLGLISNTGDEQGPAVDAVLQAAGILTFFDAPLRIYSADVGVRKEKDNPAIFQLAAARAGLGDKAQRCLFVGEDAIERETAMKAGMKVCPHPLLVEEVLVGQPLSFVRIMAPPGQAPGAWRPALRDRPLVPLRLEGPQGNTLYAIASERTRAELQNMGFGVDLLGALDAPLDHELYILRDDEAKRTGFLSPLGQSQALFADPGNSRLIISSRDGELILVLPPDRSLEDVHFKQTSHGHTEKLMPDPLLLDQWDQGPAQPPDFVMAPMFAAPAAALSAEEIQQLKRINSQAMLTRVQRYSGQSPLAPGQDGTIVSRHCRHPHNTLAAKAMAEECKLIGANRLVVRLHQFTHRGKTLYNVEAELAGQSPELVLVTAHLDSTAAAGQGYDAEKDPAPGADDDGSGVAAVLTIAECFAAMAAARPPARTIRFVLFNAEEEGLVGSHAYARHQRTLNAPVVAVFQMDMIGYNKKDPRAWEIHAGFSRSAAVEERSYRLAQRIAALVSTVSPDLPGPQLWRSNGIYQGDPAEDRSDHAAFQVRGYAACCSSEDLFVGPLPAFPENEGNPKYHDKDDREVDVVYAADIARGVAAAAWTLARDAH